MLLNSIISMLCDYLLQSREAEELRRQLVEASSELQAVQQEASEAQAAAKERHKRFTLLNATFRKKEEALISRAEDAEAALREGLADADEAQQQALLDKQVCPVLAFACSLMIDHEAACAHFTEGSGKCCPETHERSRDLKLPVSSCKQTGSCLQEAERLRKLVQSLQSDLEAAMVKLAAAEKAQNAAEKVAADASGELGSLQLQLHSAQADQARAAEWADDFEQRIADAVKGEASWHLRTFSLRQGLLGEPTSYIISHKYSACQPNSHLVPDLASIYCS